MNYLGVVQVPLSRLYYLDDIGGRQYYEKHTDHLEGLFRGTSIDHSNQRHWMDGYVDNSEMTSVLGSLGLSLMELQQKNLSLNFPRLTDHSVAYSQGRHRIEAAKKVNGGSLWTVKLFYTDMSDIHSNHTIRRRTEQYQHERPYSDGQIYSKLREHEGDELDFCEWYERFSKTKKKALLWVDRRLAISGALDALIQFPGIMESLQLGSWIKYFDWRLDDELYSGLKHIYNIWSTFTFGSHLVQKGIDSKTVELLEGRAPCVSKLDRRWIDLVFEAGDVFRGVRDLEQRRGIRGRVISSSMMIPGMKSLQSNMLYLGIAAEIIWSYLIPRELRKKAKAERMSLRSVLQSCWSGTVGYVEVKEGEFQAVVDPPSFDLAYLVVMLAALRQFACLSASKPKADTGELFTDPNCISLFRRRAKLVGFRTRNIDHAAEIPAAPFDLCSGGSFKDDLSDEMRLLQKIDYRYGRPHMSVYRLLQKMAFLPHLASQTSQPELGVRFLLQEFIRCFFRPCPFEYDLSQPVININRPPFISLGHATAAQNSYRGWSNDNRLQTITEEEYPGVLSPRMDVDSQTDNESDNRAHLSSLGHYVAATRDSACQTLVTASQPAGNLDSPGRESSGSHSSMSWEACPEHIMDAKASRNGPANIEEVLFSCSTSSRSVLPGPFSDCLAGLRKMALYEDSESRRSSSSDLSDIYPPSASLRSRSTIPDPPALVSSPVSMTGNRDPRKHHERPFQEAYDVSQSPQTGRVTCSPHLSFTSRSTIPVTTLNQPRIDGYTDTDTAPGDPLTRRSSAPCITPPTTMSKEGSDTFDCRKRELTRARSKQRRVSQSRDRYSSRTNSTVQSRSSCPPTIMTRAGSGRFDSQKREINRTRSRTRRRVSRNRDSPSTNSSVQPRSTCITPPYFFQQQDSGFGYSRTKEGPQSSEWQGFKDSDDDMVSIDLT